MAQENIGININVEGNANQSLGTLKAQLREATQEVQALSEKFGATSKEAVAAAKRAAELKDAIGDAKSLVDAFNPDAKFKALTASLSGVAGGFAAAQGAIALFGVESKEVEKALLQVQSAMALSQGLQAVGESIDSFKQLGTVIANSTIFLKANELANKATAFTMRLFGVSVEATSVSFKVLKGAIAATGLGLLVVALGEIVAAFQSYSSAAEKAAEKQKQLNDSIVKFAKVGLKAEQEFIANQEKIDIARAKAKGATEKEIFEIEQKYRKSRAESQIRFLKETKDADVEGAISTEAEIKKINIEGQVAQLEFEAKQAAARKAKAKEVSDALAEAESARIEKQLEDEKRLTEEYLAEYDKRRKDAVNAKILTQKEIGKLDQEERLRQEQENNKIFDNQIALLGKTKNFTLQAIQTQQKANEDAAKNINSVNKWLASEDKKRLDAKVSDTQSALFLLSAIVDQNSVAGKAIAVAQAIINTYQGATKALGQGGVLGFVGASAVIAAGLINVKKIVSTNIPSAKGTGTVGGGASAPSLSAGAPIAPPQPQAQTTTLDNQTINAIGNQAVRAYVVENDVTSNQQRIAAIRQRARFG
jgi:chromosome segregation ATPase